MKIIESKTGKWEMVIGLEVHAQVISGSKLFSCASTKFGAEPNKQVSLIDAAMPGMLPVVNKFCIEQAVKTGLALNGKVNSESVFDRKNYFYPDLPQGYQISQFYHPIIDGGDVRINNKEGNEKKIRIHHIHLEQDAGKSMHDYSPDKTYIDLNRAGVALMEIISEPDMRSAEEAAEYVKKLRLILRYIETCDGNMEQGSLRCDANVSVRPLGEEKFGTRCEIKNLNSIRYITEAIEYEARRQVEMIENGELVEQETRLFNVEKKRTFTMRKKEEAIDYRYFPDPDLLPVKISQELVNDLCESLPELPDKKHSRYMSELGLSEYDADVLVANKEASKYFEEVTALINEPVVAMKWITVELFARLNKAGIGMGKSPVLPCDFADLLKLISEKTISNKIAKQVFDVMFATGKSPRQIVKEMNLVQITDEEKIVKVIDEILANNQEKVIEYKNGKEKLYGFFVGQVMKATLGKANPEIVNRILKQRLSY
ncbi:MAG: Asp-tRNA(Asn)/Glu-tRNA(Gln) amidotransferase subunit GatB [Rickettsiaceae bacterium H1]|nr:Asp-tRNA(Asn)/Glu-tRNA(Gln) amidotransferase subunit GatB [Rickettsiaceae bacterium H1]